VPSNCTENDGEPPNRNKSTRGLSRNLAYHRRARLEARLGEALDEMDRQIVELRADRGS
jgi:hypothetical protein